jgi:hypothetical protein
VAIFVHRPRVVASGKPRAGGKGHRKLYCPNGVSTRRNYNSGEIRYRFVERST